MSVLTLASQIAKKPVVTFDGWDIAQVKDLIYSTDGGTIVGFTLAGRGMFAGPLKTGLPWANIVGLGPAAVVVRSDEALVPTAEVLQAAQSESGGARGNVLGSEVLTDDGTSLGAVADVVVRLPTEAGHVGEVVGYAIAPSGKRTKDQRLQFIPLPQTVAASGEHLIVPARAKEFITDDLAGFGAAVDGFRQSSGEA